MTITETQGGVAAAGCNQLSLYSTGRWIVKIGTTANLVEKKSGYLSESAFKDIKKILYDVSDGGSGDFGEKSPVNPHEYRLDFDGVAVVVRDAEPRRGGTQSENVERAAS